MFKRAVYITLFASAFLSACVGFQKQKFSDDGNNLSKRVELFYQAEAHNDWKTYYSMFAPELREQIAFDDFLKEAGEQRHFKVISWKIREIIISTTTNGSGGLSAEAKVPMDVTVEHSDGNRNKENDQTDYWVKSSGEWYWAWRGWPYD